MYGHTLLKLSNFLFKFYGQKMLPHQFVIFTTFRYYYNYYVVILRNKFELYLEDI
jgi:hypothetical protein